MSISGKGFVRKYVLMLARGKEHISEDAKREPSMMKVEGHGKVSEMKFYKNRKFEDGTIILEDYGSHLTKWLSAANLFASEQGWVS